MGVSTSARSVVVSPAPPANRLLVEPSLWREIRFNSDDWLDIPFPGFFPKLEGAKERSVIGNRNRRHFMACCRIQQWIDSGAAVEHRVVGVDVKMDELVAHVHSSCGTGF